MQIFNPVLILPVKDKDGYKLAGTFIVPSNALFKLNEQYGSVAWDVMRRLMHTPQLVCWLGERDNTFEPDSRIGRIVDFGSWGNSDDASGITFNNGDTAHVDHTRSTLHKPVNSILVNHSSKTYVNLKTWSDRVSDDPDNEYRYGTFRE